MKKIIKINNILKKLNEKDKKQLTQEERELVKKLFGEVGCSFAKNDNDKYYFYTHRARSKYYDSIKEIPKKEVEFISSTG